MKTTFIFIQRGVYVKSDCYVGMSEEILSLFCIYWIFDKHINLKYKFGNRHFWAEGYYVSTVGLNKATIRKYIQEQESHDIAMDKLSVKEYENPL